MNLTELKDAEVKAVKLAKEFESIFDQVNGFLEEQKYKNEHVEDFFNALSENFYDVEFLEQSELITRVYKLHEAGVNNLDIGSHISDEDLETIRKCSVFTATDICCGYEEQDKHALEIKVDENNNIKSIFHYIG